MAYRKPRQRQQRNAQHDDGAIEPAALVHSTHQQKLDDDHRRGHQRGHIGLIPVRMHILILSTMAYISTYIAMKERTAIASSLT
jgi:hypothetical protein